ncbi:type VI secretion system baseplate subunit TssK [Robbsia sp. Bb-Pol-6]|uniref:Type VI secretion system baseplate subunit TssK n=1 Tax=Robbsia betulipollinis TaxID=2981849 RepID=A0ABT3ZPB8_9BURK|nr:type VI secretion system baseplate subunit TssK [Robbsia betulipollinis]MCY0388386.1 type VI secretion system baseplate subunit TssK [Robbsia betulipollinis]
MKNVLPMNNRIEPVTERVEWHEGMLLSPQHLQQLSARLDSLTAWQVLAAAPFSWGVRLLRIDPGLLPSGRLCVMALDAILPDGALACHDAENPLHLPLEIALPGEAERLGRDVFDIHLSVPVASTMRYKRAIRRFRSVADAFVEDEVSNAPAIEMPRQLLNLQLMAGEPPPATHACLRLCTVRRENAVFQLDPRLPPLLEVGRDGELWRRIAATLASIRSKAAFVAKQTGSPSSRIDERLLQLELKERLHSLLAGLPLVEAVLRTPHLHPLNLYWALASMLGSVSLAKPGAMPPVLGDYDHAEPSAMLLPLLDEIDALTLELCQQFRERKFELRSGAFEIQVPPEALESRLYVGLRGQTEKDLEAWMKGAIVGPASTYASLKQRRVLGAARRGVERVEGLAVRSGAGYLLFELDCAGGMVVGGETLVISHVNESPGVERPREIVLFTRV